MEAPEPPKIQLPPAIASLEQLEVAIAVAAEPAPVPPAQLAARLGRPEGELAPVVRSLVEAGLLTEDPAGALSPSADAGLADLVRQYADHPGEVVRALGLRAIDRVRAAVPLLEYARLVHLRRGR